MREAARTTGHLLRSAPGAPPINKGDTVKVRLNDWLTKANRFKKLLGEVRKAFMISKPLLNSCTKSCRTDLTARFDAEAWSSPFRLAIFGRKKR
jgi:hypothetical protein